MKYTETVELVLLANEIITEMMPLLVKRMQESGAKFASHDIDKAALDQMKGALLLGLTKRHFESMGIVCA
jgi:hypothetical protein